MNWRRVFILIVLAFAFVGCEKKDPAIGTGSWTQEVWERGDKIYNGILRQPFLKEMAAGYRQHTQDALDGGDPWVALAAMLPCMWIYNRVGLYVLSIAKLDGNPYREWIEEYGNEEVTREVDVMLETIDGWMEKVDAKTREAMTRTYLEALLYEYAFWDYGYSGDEKDYSYVNRLEEWL